MPDVTRLLDSAADGDRRAGPRGCPPAPSWTTSSNAAQGSREAYERILDIVPAVAPMSGDEK